MSMDLSRAKQLSEAEEQGVAVPIVDEFGNPQLQDNGTPHTMTVVGSLSKRYQKIKAKNRGRALSAPTSLTLSDEERGQQSFDQQTEAVAECVIGWTPGAFVDHGNVIDYSVGNAIKVLRAYPHLQQLLERRMDDHAAFFGADSPSSNG